MEFTFRYRTTLISNQDPKLTGGQMLHTPWKKVSLTDLIIPNNVSNITVTALQSRSLSLEWTEDALLKQWKIPIHYKIYASSPCGDFEDISNLPSLDINNRLFPGQWYNISIYTVVNKSGLLSDVASIRLQTKPEIPDPPTLLSQVDPRIRPKIKGNTINDRSYCKCLETPCEWPLSHLGSGRPQGREGARS
jgi:hypothetical protein